MDMLSRPELEDLIQRDADNTVYQSLEQNVEHAVSLLAAHQTWLVEHCAETIEQ